MRIILKRVLRVIDPLVTAARTGLGIRTLLSRYFLVVLAGPERRGEARRREDRKRHPFFTRNNMWFTGILFAAVLCVAAIVGWT